MTTALHTVDDAVRLAADLGRKFEATDVAATPWLRQVATEYALAGEANAGPFMADMARAAASRWGLSNAQAKGVLNTLVARRTPRPAAPAEAVLPNVKDVPSARYRVVGADGSSTAIRLDSAAWAQDKPKGTRSVAIRTAEGWTNLGFVEVDGSVKLWQRGRPFAARLTPALTTVTDGVVDGSWLVYALAYAQEGGTCSFCDSELDTPQSLTAGYGPTCAKKRGLPWGARAEPMSVILARAAAAQAAAPPAGLTTPHPPSAPPVAPPVVTTTPSGRPSLVDLARQIEARR